MPESLCEERDVILWEVGMCESLCEERDVILWEVGMCVLSH